MLKYHPNPGIEYADYLADESKRNGQAELICFPKCEADVVEAVRYAHEHAISIAVQGGLTGISAGAVPQSGLIINLSRMNRITGMCMNDDRETEFSLLVEPGVLLEDINVRLKHRDFHTEGWSAESLDVLGKMNASGRYFFSPDPTETSASIGGMVSTNASGARSFRYQSVRPHVKGLHVVCGNGEMLYVHRGTQQVKNGFFSIQSEAGNTITGELPEIHRPAVSKTTAGYFIRPDMDLVDLFVGAEGTLGIVTQIEIGVLPEPETDWGVLAFLPDEAAALRFVRNVRGDKSGIAEEQKPVAIEFFDAGALDLIRQQREEGRFQELPPLDESFHTAVYTEYHGASEEIVSEAVLAMCEVLEACGGSEDYAWIADNPSERERLKLFRHAVPESVNAIIAERKKSYPGLTKLGTDMAVPDERLADVFEIYHRDLRMAGLQYVIFGHIGNNHVHVNILPRSLDEYETGKKLYFDWARQVVDWGGTVSAEHGIGKLKVPFLKVMFSELEREGFRTVKRVFDPDGLFNPGTLFGD